MSDWIKVDNILNMRRRQLPKVPRRLWRTKRDLGRSKTTDCWSI